MWFAPVVWVVSAIVVVLFAARSWFPPPINSFGRTYDAQWALTAGVCAVAFVAAQLLLGFVVLRYRDRGIWPRPWRGNWRLEAIWIALLAAPILGLGFTGMRIFASVQLAAPNPAALVVEVMAKQFAWSFRYPGADGKFGRTALELVNDAAGNPFGLDMRDAAARDDVVAATLRVPARRPVRLLLHSRDVIHSFFVRELRLKQDLVPGMEIPLEFRADTPGSYEIPCAELCGLGHQQMRAVLLVMPADEFDRWLKR